MEIKKAVDESLLEGWHMYKTLNAGGIFSNITFDKRTVYNRKELRELIKEGFSLDSNAGNLALNILLGLD